MKRGFYKMKRVLVTGGAGSIGVDLSRRLSEDGYLVRVLDLPICDFSNLEDIDGVEISTGDITKEDDLNNALSEVDTVLHLAALLPPKSEEDEEKTYLVNVHATQTLIEMLKQTPSAHLVFASSVTTYGDTTKENPPIVASYAGNPTSIYARSKIEAENIIRSSGCPYTILRISGISIPTFMEPPDVWPFTPDQRMEFINRDDVVTAIFQSSVRSQARETVLNIAGGPSWQMLGKEYVQAIYDVMGVPAEEAVYLDGPGSFDWYDTSESQNILGYQETSFSRFIHLLEQDVAALMSDG
jgi:nucleoside-diphosphate-sugar epimerase